MAEIETQSRDYSLESGKKKKGKTIVIGINWRSRAYLFKLSFQVPVDLKADEKEPRKRKFRDWVRNKRSVVTGFLRRWGRITSNLTLKRNED